MPRRRPRPAAGPVLAVLAVGVLAGCGAVTGAKPAGAGTQSAATPAVASTLTSCGTTRTSAGVPVEIEIEHGPVPCRAALAVERAYAQAVASGKVPGNGGGAPVKIQGWVCKGFATPEVLATGHASTCRKGAAEILAVLKPPTTASPSS